MSTHRTPSPSRRTVLRGTVGVGALAGLGLTSLSACSSGPAEDDVAANSEVVLPTYARLEGVAPDLEGDGEGIADGFLEYPSDLVTSVESPPGDGTSITAFLATSTPPPSVHDRNEFWQAVEEEVGAGLDLSIIPAGEMNDKFATLVAGNDLPDVVQVWTTPTPKADLMSAVFQDLTELVSGDAVLDYPNLANLPPEAWKHCVFKGGIHGIPIPRGTMSTQCVFMRADLLESLGIGDASPQSVDDLISLGTEITDERSNRWAFADIPLRPIQQMHRLPNTWDLTDGTLTHLYEHPAMPDALADAKRLFDSGSVHPDNFNANIGTLAKQWFNQGSALFHVDTYPAMTGFYRENTAGDSFSVDLMQFAGADGGDPVIWLGHPTHSVVGLRKGDLERTRMVLGVLNYFAAPMGTIEHRMVNFGIEGSTFEMVDGTPQLSAQGEGEINLGLMYLGAPPQAFYLEGHPEVTERQYEHQTWSAQHGIANPVLGLPSDTRDRRGEQLDKTMTDLQSEILQGRAEVSDWAAQVQTWKQNGGDAMREEYLAALEASDV